MSFPGFLSRRPLLALLALALVLGLSFQGARGLLEPDEGRYTNVALQMLHSGDFISLRRNEEALHFTKPPVTYWTIAASVSAFGRTEWAVRLPIALAFVLTVVLVFRLGKSFVPDKPWLPALIYATSPVPFIASNTVNTDTMLALMETLAVLCYAQFRFGGGSVRWLDAMWVGFGLAFMTKGPPGLLPLLAIVAFELIQSRSESRAGGQTPPGEPAMRAGLRLLRPLGLLGFAIVGLTWYVVVILRHPGLLDYFLGHEVYARIATSKLRRFPEWYGWLLYVPVLLAGSLPWLVMALVGIRKRAWRDMPADLRFLWVWFSLPLAIFCLARSRLPLYVLPLFVPLALLLGSRLASRRWWPSAPWLLLGWIVLLLSFKFAAAHFWVTDKDGRIFARQLIPMLPGKPGELLFVEDTTRNGLNLYLDTDIERLSFKPQPKMLSDSSYDQTVASELAEPEASRVFIMKIEVERYFLDAVREGGKQPIRLGTIADAQGRVERDRVVYTLVGDFPTDAAPVR